jgi:general secretion pathway protein H
MHPRAFSHRTASSRMPPVPRSSGRTATRGFSLIELVVVIALIAGATALVAGLLNAGLPGQQLRGAARELAAQMRYARAQAIVTGEAQVLRLDADTHEWTAPRGRHGELNDKIEIIAVGARDDAAGEGVATYRFFPDGASTGGHVRLRRGDAEWRVDVAWLTGEVALARGGEAK